MYTPRRRVQNATAAAPDAAATRASTSSRHELVAIVDADSAARPRRARADRGVSSSADPTASAAVGGTVRIANGGVIEQG
jgi:hypothetical protein